MANGVDDTLRKRYINKTDKEGDNGTTPSSVGLRFPTIAKLPATFVPIIIKIKDNIVLKGWKDLLHHHYFYRLLDVSLIGFKIIKNDLYKYGRVILNFNVDKVIHREYAKMLSYPSNVESCEKDYVDFD